MCFQILSCIQGLSRSMLYKNSSRKQNPLIIGCHTHHTHTHARTQKVYYLEIWNNCFCRMSSKSRQETPHTLLHFILLSISLPLSLSLPPPFSVFLLCPSLSQPEKFQTNQGGAAGSGSWGAPMATSTQASQPGGGAMFGDTRLDTGLN